MKRMMMMVAGLAMIIVAAVAVASDAVEPASASFNCLREEGEAYISGVQYYRGTSILLTNCVLYAGATTNSARQGLTDVTIDLNWGTAASNIHYTGTVIAATAGTWWASFTIPTNWEAPFLQVKITDVNTNVYIYPWKLISTKGSL